jgi:hypothetical protein
MLSSTKRTVWGPTEDTGPDGSPDEAYDAPERGPRLRCGDFLQRLRQRQSLATEQWRVLATLDAPVLHKPFRPEKLRAMIGETMALTSDDSV